jgi:hypothetical protein
MTFVSAHRTGSPVANAARGDGIGSTDEAEDSEHIQSQPDLFRIGRRGQMGLERYDRQVEPVDHPSQVGTSLLGLTIPPHVGDDALINQVGGTRNPRGGLRGDPPATVQLAGEGSRISEYDIGHHSQHAAPRPHSPAIFRVKP